MTWKALVAPRKDTRDYPGMCLRFSQTFFGAPVNYPDAWTAWQNQKFRHDASEPLPDVPVLLWFEHWGTYGDPPTYKNWGHVAPYVPGDAIYSSPATWNAGWSQSRFATISDLERALNCRYVGWSEDLNGLRIAENTGTPSAGKPNNRKSKGLVDMIIIRSKASGHVFAIGPKYIKHLKTAREVTRASAILNPTQSTYYDYEVADFNALLSSFDVPQSVANEAPKRKTAWVNGKWS